MKTTATNRKLRVLITGIRAGTLIPRPEFQRRLVWANRHKLGFLDTVLKGYPFPEIYVAAGEVDPETAEGSEMLVDGQQRISTLYEYFTGAPQLRLGSTIPPYTALAAEAKHAFLEYDVVVRDLGQISLEEIREVFTRINSTNYALNAMEINNARYDGAFKRCAERLVDHPFFVENAVFTSADVRRMNDLRFILTLMVTSLETYFNRDDELSTFLLRYNDEFPQEEKLNAELERVFVFLSDCEFPPRGRFWRKPDLFTVLVETHRLLVRKAVELDPAATRERLIRFYQHVEAMREEVEAHEDVLKYYKASIQATNDRGNRIQRAEVIQKVLTGHSFVG